MKQRRSIVHNGSMDLFRNRGKSRKRMKHQEGWAKTGQPNLREGVLKSSAPKSSRDPLRKDLIPQVPENSASG